MPRSRRDRDNPRYWMTSVVMIASLFLIHDLVRHFTSLGETTGFVASGCIWFVCTCIPVWLMHRSTQ